MLDVGMNEGVNFCNGQVVLRRGIWATHACHSGIFCVYFAKICFPLPMQCTNIVLLKRDPQLVTFLSPKNPPVAFNLLVTRQLLQIHNTQLPES